MTSEKCKCGAGEAEVHRRRCEAWMTNKAEAGSAQCRDCGGGFRVLRNERCMVCGWWYEMERRDMPVPVAAQ